MKHLKQWTAVLSVLILALMTVAGAFAEALPAEEPAELFGFPWVNSNATGNLPETAPDLKDDFYTSVNYDFLAANQEAQYYLPAQRAGQEIQDAVTALLQDESLADDEITQLRIFWEQAADLDALHESAYTQVLPYLERVDAAASIEELNTVLTAEDFPFSPYLAMPVAPLALNEENGVWIFPALSMTTDYLNGANQYTGTIEDTGALMQKLSSFENTLFLRAVLSALGIGNEDLADVLLELFNTEAGYVKEGYSELMASVADYGYISNAPQRMTLAELGSLCSRFPLTATLAKFGKDKAPAFIILYPAWLTELDHLWTEENLDRVKLLTRFKVLMEAMPYLDPDLVNDVRTLNGLSVLNAETNPWFVCNRVNTFGHLLAKLYAEKILGSEMKEKLVSIVRGLVDTYRTLLDETEWLSADGRSNALEKLDHIRLNILEPDGGYYDFSGLELIPASEGGTLFTSYLAVKAYLNEQENRYIGKPAKADIVWKAPNPLSANCFYDAFSNTVNLLPGFIFSILCTADSTEAEMLGGIGTVIAHEISHALDFAGSQCDAYGRGASILTDADREIFLDKVKAVEEYYNAITILPGTNCRGTFLRVENTADMAGMRAAAMLAKSLGLDLADFFCEYARIYAMTASPLMLEYLNTVDTHAFSYLRTNVNIQMTDEFYEAFGIKEGDGMYIRPEDRLRIWGK